MPRSRRCPAAAVLLALAACGQPAPGRVEPAAPPAAQQRAPVRAPAFDARRAFAHLERQVAFGPRVPGTAGHQRQLAWMRAFLAARADTLIAQHFTHRTASSEALALTNLWARFRPELDERILLVAHWDTRPHADAALMASERARPVPGANDGASGTALLLELATLLAERPPPVGVDLLFTDGEDYGPDVGDMLLGARYFAATLPAGYAPRYAVVLDMVADREPRFPVEAYSAQRAPAVVEHVWATAAALGYADVFPREVGEPIADDHLPLLEAGIPAAVVIDLDYGPGNRYWHTQDDVPRNTSVTTLGIVGRVVTALVYGAAGGP